MCQARDDCSSRLTIFLCHMVRMSMLSWHGKCSSEELVNTYLPDPQHRLYILNCTVYNSFCTFEAKSKLYRFEQHPCNVGTAFNYSYETYIYQIQPENCWIVEKSNEGEIVVILRFFGCWGINTAPASALLQSNVIVKDLNALKFQTSSQAQNYARRLQPKNYD